MLKIGLSAVLGLLPLAVQAQANCVVNYDTAYSDVAKVIEASNGWQFKNYAAICAKLTEARARLLIAGDTAVLTGQSVAWASVSLRDGGLPIVSVSYGGSATKTYTEPSPAKGEQLLFVAINDAIDAMDMDRALEGLAEARRKVEASAKK